MNEWINRWHRFEKKFLLYSTIGTTVADRGTEPQRVYVFLYTNSAHKYMKYMAFEGYSNDRQDELLLK